jgi:hypothetical protein
MVAAVLAVPAGDPPGSEHAVRVLTVLNGAPGRSGAAARVAGG